MAERRSIPPQAAAAPARKATPKTAEAITPTSTSAVRFFSSGSFLLDLILGGGWARGRVFNIVGDKGAGKTLLAVEACANFARITPAQNIRYAEPEHAFDEEYTSRIGMPDGVQRTEDYEITTVEQLDSDLDKWLTHREKEKRETNPSLYLLDSLDALSDDAEMDRAMGEATYGTAKAKAVSELFRKKIARLASTDTTFGIISQIRDNIGVTFGETKKRSGGRALDFYASQVVWLAEKGKIKRTVRGNERIVGAVVIANCKKNKVGMAYRRVELTVIYNYGVDDEVSMVNWLRENKCLKDGADKEIIAELTTARSKQDRNEVFAIGQMLRGLVKERWEEIEAALQPALSKYGR